MYYFLALLFLVSGDKLANYATIPCNVELRLGKLGWVPKELKKIVRSWPKTARPRMSPAARENRPPVVS